VIISLLLPLYINIIGDESYMADEILAKILERQKINNEIVSKLLMEDGKNEAIITSLLEKYIQNKYILEEKDLEKRDIIQLAKLSIARLAGIDFSQVKYKDGKDCSGVNSFVAKKILLLIALERDLGLKLPDEESGDIETIDDLEKLVSRCMREKNVRS